MTREVKLPSYWHSRPAAWLQLGQSRFRARRNTDSDSQVKFDYMVSSLPDELVGDDLDVLMEVADVEDP